MWFRVYETWPDNLTVAVIRLVLDSFNCTAIKPRVTGVTMNQFIFYIIIFGFFVPFGFVETEAKVFSKCELETELIRRNVSYQDVEPWICFADVLSSSNSSTFMSTNSAEAPGKTDGQVHNHTMTSYYGIFQISGKYCSPEEDAEISQSICEIRCFALLDDYISDDIDCARKIMATNSDSHQNESWAGFWSLCKLVNKNLTYPRICNEKVETFNDELLQSALRSPEITNLKNGDRIILKKHGAPDMIHCRASGDPTPQLRWEYNETEFPNLYSLYNPSGGILIFPDTNTSFESKFTCKAINKAGTTNVTITVTLGTKDIGGSMMSTSFIFGFISGLVLSIFIICLAYGVVQCRRINAAEEKVTKARGLTKEEIDEFRNGDPDGLIFNAFAHENARFQAYNNDYEIMDNQLVIETDKLLGSGAFGMVYKGWKGDREVAVKTIKPSADKLYIKALLSELKVMIYLGKHEHIVNLIGAKTMDLDKGSLYIVVEFCALGNLESFIRNSKHNFQCSEVQPEAESESYYANVTSSRQTYVNISGTYSKRDLLHWSFQIASGMKYLASKKVIHGDLATRNILLSDKDHLKITDFGLSRQLYDYTNYVKKQQAPLPWRWMAIESLRSMTFSPQSDIWSFAITLWEIYTLGEVPYAGLSWTLDFADQVENGLRLLRPKQCPDALFEKMTDCWHCVPSERPDISFMYSFIANLLAKGEVEEV